MKSWKKGSCSMEPCDLCEEEIVTSGERIEVAGKKLALCDECHSHYKKGGIKELNKRRDV